MATTQQMSPPWSNFPIPSYIRTELRRRASYGLNSPGTPNTQTVYSDAYKGPLTSWIRVASLAEVKFGSMTSPYKNVNKIIEGFVFSQGNVGFYDRYGINNNVGSVNPGKLQTVGYDRRGNPIQIDNTNDSVLQKFRPPPVIASISVDIKKDVYRQAEIHWKCFSLAQLELMIPFFLNPVISVTVEWGWNNFSSDSLLDLSPDAANDKFIDPWNAADYGLVVDKNTSEISISGSGFNVTKVGNGIFSAFSCPEIFERNVKKSSGNYDGMIGRITNYGFSFDSSDNSFNCTTTIASNSKFVNAMLLNNLTNESKVDGGDDTKKSTNSFKEYFEKYFEQQMFANADSNVTDYEKTHGLQNLNVADRLCVFSPSDYVAKPSGFLGSGYTLAWQAGSISDSLVIKSTQPFFNTTAIGNKKKKYVALKLFFNEINNFIISQKAINWAKTGRNTTPTYGKILFRGEMIGGDINMISWDVDILIPNAKAPFYYPESFLDERLVLSTSILDQRNPFFLSGKFSPPTSDSQISNQDDAQVFKILRSTHRQNLNKVLNYRTTDQAPLAFPSIDSPDRGLLENIYVSTDFVKEACQTESIEDLLKYVCNRLNNLFPNKWNLIVIKDSNNVYINDENFFPTKPQDLNNKTQFGVDTSDTYLYYLEPFVQESISENFKFEVAMKDSIASAILNHVQHDNGQSQINSPSASANPATATPLTVQNALITSPTYDVWDPISLKLTKIADRKKELAINPDKQKELLAGALKSINEGALIFRRVESTSATASDHILESQLTIPEIYKSKAMSLLANPTGGDSSSNNAVMPGTSVEFEILGLGGFKTFQILAVKNLPEPYTNKFVFQIKELKHQLESNSWKTTVVCAIRPVGDISKFG